MTHLIIFKSSYNFIWEDVAFNIDKGEVITCTLSPAISNKQACCNIFLPAGIIIYNVPDKVFDVLIGQKTSDLRKDMDVYDKYYSVFKEE